MIKHIIFDWKRTLYDPETQSLIYGAKELLEFIKSKDMPLILIGKGGADMKQEVKRLKLRQFFSQIVFAEGEKDPQVFEKYIPPDDPKSTLIIGDRIRSELQIGKNLGAITIWIKQGKFAIEEPENEAQKPDYIVSSPVECLRLLQDLFD